MVSDRSNGIYRGVIAAALGLGLVGAAPEKANIADNAKATSEQAGQEQLHRIASALEKFPHGEAKDAGCSKGHDNRQSDLCAQWKAADAASDAAIWAMRTFWAGIFGLGIGGFTLFFAGRAAHWAKHAAHETKRSADIAWEVGLAQSSPYLTVDEAHGFHSDGIRIFVTIANQGASPASGIVPFGIFYVGNTNSPQIVGRIKKAEKSKTAVGAHLTQTLELTCASSAQFDILACIKKDMITPGIILLGILYSDEFGNTWIQRQRINVRICQFKTDSIAADFKFEGAANKVAPPRRRIGRARDR